MKYFGTMIFFLGLVLSSTVSGQELSFTLGRLVLESDYIVIAKGKVQKTEEGAQSVPVNEINLEVQSQLKGMSDPLIKVSTQTHGPGDKPLFSFKAPILYFLHAPEDSTETLLWVTGNRSGSRVVAPFGLVRYSGLIQELLQIDTLPEGEERTNALVEWNVKCVEGQYGTTDGMLELLGKGYFFSAPGIKVKELLTVQQRKRLFDVLLKVTDFDYLHLEMLPLVYGVNDLKLQQFLVDKMKDPSNLSPRFALTVMTEIQKLNQSDRCKAFIKEYEDIRWNDPERKEKRRVLLEGFYKAAQELITEPTKE
ncbi:MAG: hypothetical protein ACFB10_06770 [Salibacteraceae bacterium]